MARQSEMLNNGENVGSIQQKKYWAQHTALWNAAETADWSSSTRTTWVLPVMKDWIHDKAVPQIQTTRKHDLVR